MERKILHLSDIVKLLKTNTDIDIDDVTFVIETSMERCIPVHLDQLSVHEIKEIEFDGSTSIKYQVHLTIENNKWIKETFKNYDKADDNLEDEDE